ncbi:MAG TPA: hypothetical protein V6D17_21685 [Candidatus Obscuribacterales bacterium]
MIEGIEPAEFRRQMFGERGKPSFVPNERRYNSDGAYAFKLDSRADYNYASLVVCKLVDEIELQVTSGKNVSAEDLNAWHVDYAKAGFRAADMAEIAIALARDPAQALRQMKQFLMAAPALPGLPIPGAYFMGGV